MRLKKYFYIFLAAIGGGLLGFLFYALIELWYIPRLINNFPIYGLGFSWQTWFTIHKIFAIVAPLVGLSAGYLQGSKWWQYLYVEHKYKGLIKSLFK